MKSKVLALFAGLALVLTALNATPANAGTLDMGIGPEQSEIDSMDGGWDSSQIGSQGRPFIVEATLNGDSIYSSNEMHPGTEAGVDGWRVLVSPNNVCHSNQTPEPGVCYADPNRVSIDLAYVVNGDTKHDFSGPSLSSLGIDSSSVFEFVIDLNEMKDDLSWTWVNGVPHYWGFESDDSQVRLSVSPTDKPSNHNLDNFCTTIPVSTCSTNKASDEIFTVEIVMSFDDTLDSIFDHALFASSNAVIASLETGEGFNPETPDANSITYGLSAPHLKANNEERQGNFWALITPEIAAAFGIENIDDVPTSLNITRSSDDEGTFNSNWVSWNADEFGTAGYLLELSNITFSVPKFTVNNGNQVERPSVPKTKVNKFRTFTQLIIDLGLLQPGEKIPAGVKVTVTVNKASKKICKVVGKKVKALKKGTCKYKITIKQGGQSQSTNKSFKVIK